MSVHFCSEALTRNRTAALNTFAATPGARRRSRLHRRQAAPEGSPDRRPKARKAAASCSTSASPRRAGDAVTALPRFFWPPNRESQTRRTRFAPGGRCVCATKLSAADSLRAQSACARSSQKFRRISRGQRRVRARRRAWECPPFFIENMTQNREKVWGLMSGVAVPYFPSPILRPCALARLRLREHGLQYGLPRAQDAVVRAFAFGRAVVTPWEAQAAHDSLIGPLRSCGRGLVAYRSRSCGRRFSPSRKRVFPGRLLPPRIDPIASRRPRARGVDSGASSVTPESLPVRKHARDGGGGPIGQ